MLQITININCWFTAVKLICFKFVESKRKLLSRIYRVGANTLKIEVMKFCELPNYDVDLTAGN